MITVGLINELRYLHEITSAPIKVSLQIADRKSLNISIQNELLELEYNKQKIWSESLNKSTSLFGLESVEVIMNIIEHIDNEDATWTEKFVHSIP